MRRIGDVKGLRPELHAQPFIDMKITKHAGIEIGGTRPTQGVVASSPERDRSDWSECRFSDLLASPVSELSESIRLL